MLGAILQNLVATQRGTRVLYPPDYSTVIFISPISPRTSAPCVTGIEEEISGKRLCSFAVRGYQGDFEYFFKICWLILRLEIGEPSCTPA
jgi:hypothetical protein